MSGLLTKDVLGPECSLVAHLLAVVDVVAYMKVKVSF